MTKAHLENIANQFCQAIVTAKENRAFANNDRMSMSPRGCCDDTADLFFDFDMERVSEFDSFLIILRETAFR